jgi:hypothetical protein
MKSFQILIGLMVVTEVVVAGAGLSRLPEQIASGTDGRDALDGGLPKDVNPDSRSRLALIKREALDERGKWVYDAAGPGGPQGAIALRLHRSGVDVRWDSPLGRQLTELAIITTAREHDQPYEWSLHEMEAVAVGLAPAVIDVVQYRKPLTGLTVSAETYARAVKVFGQRDLSDFVVGVMAPHARDAAMLTAFDQHLPPGQKPLLPMP